MRRPMETSDMDDVTETFNDAIGMYYEHLFPWAEAGYSNSVLFPEFTWEDIKHKYNVANPSPDEFTNTGSFYNIAFVKLNKKR